MRLWQEPQLYLCGNQFGGTVAYGHLHDDVTFCVHNYYVHQVFGLLLVSDFSGVVLVISEKSACVWNLRPGLVGLRLLIATFSPIHQTIQ